MNTGWFRIERRTKVLVVSPPKAWTRPVLVDIYFAVLVDATGKKLKSELNKVEHTTYEAARSYAHEWLGKQLAVEQ